MKTEKNYIVNIERGVWLINNSLNSLSFGVFSPWDFSLSRISLQKFEQKETVIAAALAEVQAIFISLSFIPQLIAERRRLQKISCDTMILQPNWELAVTT